MSPVGPPSALRAVAILRRLARLRRRRAPSRWIAPVLAALPVLATGLLALTGRWGRDLFDHIVDFHLRFLVLFLPALALADAVAEEIEQQTFTFLFTRPAPRWTLPIGKYLAVVPSLTALLSASVVVSFAIALLVPPAGPRELWQELPALGRALAAIVLGVPASGAVAILLGTWFPRHPLVAVLGYLLLVEGFLGSLPLVTSLNALGWHLRNVAHVATEVQSIDATDVLSATTVSLPPLGSAAALLGLTLLALVGVCWAVRSAEYRPGR
jgi:ABC-type Na+ efflux pump permease subunit